ncbi:hypothetical protein [Chryseobacterium paridis]|uniref:Beta-carotene 15,15'-monooxygenase n=1 Tax=Chryseobacterium paridis TaxID=2800328 RepID=A0ABS1FUR4_9FLAO|nr:hypothetical protein [Chryseobacterium paridis]MBK1896152.1 hypothetical protein [Chryseobacterium paridis]
MAKKSIILFSGFIIAILVSLSIHIVMLQVIGVQYPDNSGVPLIPRLLNKWLSILALFIFYYLAKDKLSKKSIIIQSIIVFLLYSMLKEVLIRANLMEGVVTTSWIFPFIKAGPQLLGYLILAFALVISNFFIKKKWQLFMVSILITCLFQFIVEPMLNSLFAPIIASYSHLAHEAIYELPYGWHVLVPAYLTFAEPVIAAFVIVYYIWDNIAGKAWQKVVSIGILICLIKGALFPLFLFTPYLKLKFTSAVASEIQFTLEFLALGILTSAFWAWSQKK